jgi:hypothetical protein
MVDVRGKWQYQRKPEFHASLARFGGPVRSFTVEKAVIIWPDPDKVR